MANDQHQTKGRHHGSSSNSSRHGKKHRATTTTKPLPAVPPAQPNLLQYAHQQLNPVPVIDPEIMPAKQGLNEWGAFTGGGNSSSSESGTFGLGPLLFRHGGAEEMETTTTRPPPLTGRDLVEMDRLLRTDPVSFNPMQAISWARLDEDMVVVEETPPPPQQREKEPSVKGKGKVGSSRDGGGGGVEYQQVVSSAGASGKPHQSGRDDHVVYTMAPTTGTGAPLSTSTPRNGAYSRGSENPAPSPVVNMAQTFSNMDVAVSDGYSVFVPPVTVSTSNPTHRVDSVQPQVRQQRKHRHRHEKKAGIVQTDLYAQQETTNPPSSFPTSSTSVSASTQPYPPQYQIAYTNYSTTSPSNQSFQTPATLPQQQQDIGLLLCLAPSCQARFASEAQLNAHYQAFHAASHSTHGRHQHPHVSSDNLECSWTLCGAGGFTSNNALAWHVKAEHLLLCPVPGCCDRVFPSRKQLDGHVKNRVG